MKMKQRLDRAMQWLDQEPCEMASTTAGMFDVKPSSIRRRQLRKRHPQRNAWGTFNRHGGNNVILTEAQELAVL